MTTDISIVRWDPTLQQEIVEDYEYDGGNSSSRLFERSRIKALAGKYLRFFYTLKKNLKDIPTLIIETRQLCQVYCKLDLKLLVT